MLGIDWTIRTSAADNQWRGITYGNGLFVAVSLNGSITSKVMTSPDGINWTLRTAAADNQWYDVTYGNGLFVAVASSGTGNRVMTSPDGINWTIRTSAADNNWYGITYGNGLFVAVSGSGSYKVMTSPDGITWTLSMDSSYAVTLTSITHGNGLFVAISIDGYALVSSDEIISWVIYSVHSANSWRSVTYGNGLFVAVSSSGAGGNRVKTSSDGITWTPRTAAANNSWFDVTYGNGLFVAVSLDGTGNRVMTSPDGINWTIRSSAADNSWISLTYGNNMFAAVSISGEGNRVMTSGVLTCVLGSTKILMKNGSLKEIKDIIRGDEILENAYTNKTNIVSRVISMKISNTKMVKIPKNTMNNFEDLHISEVHPIWVNQNKNRILAKNVKEGKSYIIQDDTLYNLQFDTEGCFYANGIKIDSLSPYHKYYPLPLDLFMDKNNYIKDVKIMNEDDKIRKKPKMIKFL